MRLRQHPGPAVVAGSDGRFFADVSRPAVSVGVPFTVGLVFFDAAGL
ncbi:hypothetical protein ACIHEJ_28080 [Streptomyces sp. NPDC052301]